MRNLIFSALFFLASAFSSPAQADDYDSALARLEELENRLINIKNDSADIPAEELDKASEWIEAARGGFKSGRPGSYEQSDDGKGVLPG